DDCILPREAKPNEPVRQENNRDDNPDRAAAEDNSSHSGDERSPYAADEHGNEEQLVFIRKRFAAVALAFVEADHRTGYYDHEHTDAEHEPITRKNSHHWAVLR